MHRFHLPPDQCLEPSIFLAGREAHHALRVLRVRRGDRVIVLDGTGAELHCEVGDSDRDKVQLAVLERKSFPRPGCAITLLQGIPKGKLMESIIQKATELGAFRIVPILTERVAIHLDQRGAALKAAKWQTVAVEAIKQCGSPWLPKVEEPMTPAQFLARKERFDLPLIASLGPDRLHPHEYFRQYSGKHGAGPHTISVWVGPEGDFTPDEIAAVVAAGALPITLGPLVLRCETAATYCLSVLNYEATSSRTVAE
jgi:16S rRNA (uracil1498-N3)-methyltransferase